MSNLKETLLSELPNFREKSLKFLNGDISKPEYKGFSGGYGVYAQRDKKSFMIRLRTSCGVISKSQLHTIYNMAYENKLEKIAGRPVLYKIHNKLDEDDSIFNQLIGFNGSLAKSIQDIKSTLLYPGKKPVILLSGESGTGKSLLAKKIYEFSKEKGLINENGQLVKLNCKYFMNDETMIKNLFIDYGKAALEKAKNGMVYFDNVHLIPEKYKSIIYDLIEMSSLKENNFMVVLSSDCFNENDLKSNALDNISIKIDLPSLDKRGLVERMELVQGCFK